MSGADGAGALPWDAFTEDEILTMGEISPDYDVIVISLFATLRF